MHPKQASCFLFRCNSVCDGCTTRGGEEDPPASVERLSPSRCCACSVERTDCRARMRLCFLPGVPDGTPVRRRVRCGGAGSDGYGSSPWSDADRRRRQTRAIRLNKEQDNVFHEIRDGRCVGQCTQPTATLCTREVQLEGTGSKRARGKEGGTSGACARITACAGRHRRCAQTGLLGGLT